MAKKYKWKIQGYGHDVIDKENHMNKMSVLGWEVFKIQEVLDKAELSQLISSELSNGDSFSFRSTTFIYYRKRCCL